MMKYFIKDGSYIGGYDEGSVSLVPDGCVEVPLPPENAQDVWDGSKWVEWDGAYINKRVNEYPSVGDQLDAILKGFNQLRLEGTQLPEDLDMVLGQWLAVKNKFPKGK